MQPDVGFDVLTIGGVEPLPDQFGAEVKRTVPDILRDALFGTPAGVDDASELRSYAVLDAAKVTNLAETLEASDLRHDCLFAGAALDQLGDAAPWLVDLTEDDPLVGRLFTPATDAKDGWGLWDREPGIFVRTRLSLDELRSHLRRFTRVRDENGKWYLFRFWEPSLLGCLIDDRNQSTDFWQSFLPVGQLLICDPLLQTATVVSGWHRDSSTFPFRLQSPHFDIMRRQRRVFQSRQIVRQWQAEGKLPHATRELIETVEKRILQGQTIGLAKQDHLRRFAELCERAEGALGDWLAQPNVRRTVAAGHPAGRLIAELEFDVEDLMQEVAR